MTDLPDAQLEELREMRKLVEGAIYDDDTAARDLASLSRRFRDIIKETDEPTTRLRALTELRAHVKGVIQSGVAPRDLSSLTKQWQDIGKEADELQQRQELESKGLGGTRGGQTPGGDGFESV